MRPPGTRNRLVDISTTIDAGSLFGVLAATPNAPAIRRRLSADDEQVAPHLVDVEVFSVIRRQHAAGRLDDTAAAQAVEDLRDWPGERLSHRLLLGRAWELRDTVRGHDAMYVALAEMLNATLLTTDSRLARATGPTCTVELLPATT